MKYKKFIFSGLFVLMLINSANVDALNESNLRLLKDAVRHFSIVTLQSTLFHLYFEKSQAQVLNYVRNTGVFSIYINDQKIILERKHLFNLEKQARAHSYLIATILGTYTGSVLSSLIKKCQQWSVDRNNDESCAHDGVEGN